MLFTYFLRLLLFPLSHSATPSRVCLAAEPLGRGDAEIALIVIHRADARALLHPAAACAAEPHAAACGFHGNACLKGDLEDGIPFLSFHFPLLSGDEKCHFRHEESMDRSANGGQFFLRKRSDLLPYVEYCKHR